MWGSNKAKRKQTGFTLIANNCKIVGDVQFSDKLQVDGVVKGNIIAQSASAAVNVSERGEVKGEIRVPCVVIDGTIQGDIHSEKHIELAAKSTVTGNVYYNDIEMVKGSRVDGNLIHVSDVGKAVAQKSIERERTTVHKVATASDQAI